MNEIDSIWLFFSLPLSSISALSLQGIDSTLD